MHGDHFHIYAPSLNLINCLENLPSITNSHEAWVNSSPSLTTDVRRLYFAQKKEATLRTVLQMIVLTFIMEPGFLLLFSILFT